MNVATTYGLEGVMDERLEVNRSGELSITSMGVTATALSLHQMKSARCIIQ